MINLYSSSQRPQYKNQQAYRHGWHTINQQSYTYSIMDGGAEVPYKWKTYDKIHTGTQILTNTQKHTQMIND